MALESCMCDVYQNEVEALRLVLKNVLEECRLLKKELRDARKISVGNGGIGLSGLHAAKLPKPMVADKAISRP